MRPLLSQGVGLGLMDGQPHHTPAGLMCRGNCWSQRWAVLLGTSGSLQAMQAEDGGCRGEEPRD